MSIIALARKNRRRPGRGALTCLAVAAAMLLVGGMAEAPLAVDSAALPQQPAVTFASLHEADLDLHYKASQVRRIRTRSGQWLGIREKIEQRKRSAATGEPRFQLTFAGAENLVLNPAELEKRARAYAEHSGYIHLHQGFRVSDPVLAAQNYKLVPVDTKQRLGRVVDRFLLHAPSLNRNLWLLEVDRLTGLPLYRAEFTPGFQMVSELEITNFNPLGAAAAGPEGNWGWQPYMIVTPYASPPVALAALAAEGAGMQIPDANMLPVGFSMHDVHVTESQLQTSGAALVVGFTDGIDEVYFVQRRSGNPFAALPMKAQEEAETQMIAVFTDGSHQEYSFYEKGVTSRIVGRGGLVGLPGAAEAFYRTFLN